MDSLASIAAAVSAFFAAIAAAGSFYQAYKAAESNEVNVYLNMLDAYGSASMRNTISSLAAFWRTHQGSDVGQAFLDLLARDPEAARVLRGHSRDLSTYFVNAARLFEGQLISKRLLRLLISHPGLNVFYDVAVPINLSRNPHHNSGRYAKILKHVVVQHGDGVY
jgi:hypothetical protein